MNKKKLTIILLAILATILLIGAIGGTSVLASEALEQCSNTVPQNLKELTETLPACVSTGINTFILLVFYYIINLMFVVTEWVVNNLDLVNQIGIVATFVVAAGVIFFVWLATKEEQSEIQ